MDEIKRHTEAPSFLKSPQNYPRLERKTPSLSMLRQNKYPNYSKWVCRGHSLICPKQSQYPHERLRACSRQTREPTVIYRIAFKLADAKTIEDDQEKFAYFEDKRRYEPLKELGKGAMGRLISFVIPTSYVPSPQAPLEGKQNQQIARLVEEVRTLGQLNHPNIVPIHDVGVDANGEYFFVMKYVGGSDLSDIIQRLKSGDKAAHEKYPFAERLRIFKQVIEAVVFAQSHGIIHRDLKPENIRVGEQGEVFLMDWGVATCTTTAENEQIQRDRKLTGLPTIESHEQWSRQLIDREKLIGTPAYMAPEQVQGHFAAHSEI